MKKIDFKAVMALIGVILLAGCYGEKSPEPKWEYGGPDPEITDGPSEAQKMCYELYTKYDIHVYYNLEGMIVGKTPLGFVQTGKIKDANPWALPFLPADEESGEIFLKQLTGFYSLLPDDMVSHGLFRRQVLVMINPAPTYIKDENNNRYFSCAHSEDQIGIIIYGYKEYDKDTDSSLILNPDGWKWNICYNFFRGHVNESHKYGVDLPADFELVSKGLYYYDNVTQPKYRFYNASKRIYNRPLAKECGFVHPFGGINSWSGNPYADWGSYAAWILMVPYEERSEDLEKWPRINTKYEMVMNYYKSKYNIDLETIGVDYRALIIE